MRQYTLRQVRALLNLSQAELAKELGVTRVTVTNWELGKKPMSLTAFKLLCRIAELSEDSIILPKEFTQS